MNIKLRRLARERTLKQDIKMGMPRLARGSSRVFDDDDEKGGEDDDDEGPVQPGMVQRSGQRMMRGSKLRLRRLRVNAFKKGIVK